MNTFIKQQERILSNKIKKDVEIVEICDNFPIMSKHQLCRIEYDRKTWLTTIDCFNKEQSNVEIPPEVLNTYGNYYNYFDSNSGIEIFCPEHGKLDVTMVDHLDGKECDTCQVSNTTNNTDDDAVCDEKVYDTHLEYVMSSQQIYYSKNNKFGSVVADLYIPTYQLAIFKIDKNSNVDLIEQCCESANIQCLMYSHENDTLSLSWIQSRFKQKVFIYTHDMHQQDMMNITDKLPAELFDSKTAVFGVYRGALAITQHLSNKFKWPMGIVKYNRYDGVLTKKADIVIDVDRKLTNILLVDDLTSSGETMKKAEEILIEQHGSKVNIVKMVIFGSSNHSDIISLRNHPKQWIDFWWEI